ncbi:DUF3151 domain-containing protein [Corynebacterium sp. 320]|uniref:DUF3151 domain-containing protein n=1 Tax=Corynebacterium TaxID=1716 RepID=UPI00125CC2F8|nr:MULTISPECIES: DUF3151 domain-containing protein [Corynebacterium]KAB1503991.1 DUF3151 domain-containing protein [Corynebacterium sp. 320]KAB1552910.1 DUF3151 domain-containing protein [Corynebacterium sp. 321]KAB1553872.1 DUF3151 domain-containing protein [Corynebacterium sp. 319]KAB3528127.1 DUF3151 domain-containing protein [Corynebacterium sp. 250]KAB3540385.1 DUF3151 domain-containing protein [Corynebacterium sp. 366]
MVEMKDMMAPPPVKLPEENIPADIGVETALKHPESPLVWATIAERAIGSAETDDQRVAAYAAARTGYHRSLDRLRANGWKGWGPVPFDHRPNQGVLRAIAALALASKMIDDDAEYDRCRQMLSDADPSSVQSLIDDKL